MSDKVISLCLYSEIHGYNCSLPGKNGLFLQTKFKTIALFQLYHDFQNMC